MALKRYRAVGSGLVSHPFRKTFVGYERVIDGSTQSSDLVVPGGNRFRKLENGEVVQDTPDLRNAARQGALEELPVELRTEGTDP